MSRCPLVIAVCLSILGCASIAPPLTGRYSITPDAPHRSGAHDLYQAVERLKPSWLDPCLTVFRGDRWWGDREALKEFTPADVDGVHYIPAGHPRPGAGSTAINTCPAIQVLTAAP